MTGAVAFAFAFGVLAPLAPAGIPWALGALGLGAASTDAAAPGIRASLLKGVARGALAGIAFASLLILAAGLEEAGLDVSDGLTVPNLLLSVALVALGLALTLGAGRLASTSSQAATVLFALAYAVISIPGVLGILHRLLERSAEQGAGGVAGAAILVTAGAATAFAAISVAGVLLGRIAGQALRRAISTVAVIAGGAISLVYWLPGARGDTDDPANSLGETLADISQGVGEVLTGNLLVPALFFLTLGVWALLEATRAERARG